MRWRMIRPFAAVQAPLVLTPHPGEMARLVGSDTNAVQGNRLGLAQSSAAGWRATLVLKGANTIVADADGRASVSAIANAALATAGSGDVLAGAIGGLLAQGMSPFDASRLAVYLHGNSGERAARTRGSAGTTASDILEHLALAGRSLAGEEPAGGDGGGSLPFGLGAGVAAGGMGDMSRLLGGAGMPDPGAGFGGAGLADPFAEEPGQPGS